MIEELGFYSKQEKEMLLYSIQIRSKAQAASYPVGTRFVLGVMRLERDANHSTSTAVVSSWHGDKSRTGITTLPFCLYNPQHRNENLHVLDTTFLHLHTKFMKWTEHVWCVALQCDGVRASLVM